jgi:cytosine/adenosine deaminase-related metal-dependent hydrolase
MSYRKFKADYLFDGLKMHDQGAVLVCQEDGRIESILAANQAGADPEEFPGMIVPGFVNCHCHLELSHLKGLIPEKQGLVNFLLSVVNRRNAPQGLIQESIRREEDVMQKTGIVAVGDICNTPDTLIQKTFNRLCYYNFIELFGWSPEQAGTRYQDGKKLASQFLEGGLDNTHLSLIPHAPYSVSDPLWKLMEADFRGKTISIHNQESEAENDFFSSGGGDLVRMYDEMKIDTSHFNAPGTRSLPYYLQKISAAAQIMLVHNLYTSETDLNLAMKFHENLFFCLCPNANQYIENRLPDIPLFRKYNAMLVLGTDSLASNHQLSILDEMKTIKNAFPFIPTAEMLVWATSNGAKALSFDDKLGDFNKGKKPGIVLIENLHNGEIHEETTSRRII